MLGVLAAAFVLVPRFGLANHRSDLCDREPVLRVGGAQGVRAAARGGAGARCRKLRRHLRVLAVTGLLGIGYEVLVVRVLSQVAENTVYTFAILLAVYLIGTTLGAAAYSRWAKRALAHESHARPLAAALAAACLVGRRCASRSPRN